MISPKPTYVESSDFLKELSLVLNSLPEQNKVTLLQNVSNIDDLLHCVVSHLTRQQQVFAKNEIA